MKEIEIAENYFDKDEFETTAKYTNLKDIAEEDESKKANSQDDEDFEREEEMPERKISPNNSQKPLFKEDPNPNGEQ